MALGDKSGARVRAAAAEAVNEVVSNGRSLDAVIKAAEDRVAADDRALLRMLCFGTLRNFWRLQEWADALLDRPLKKRDSVVGALLLVGLFQLTDTRIPQHAAVSQSVEAARLLRRPRHAGLLNAIFRRFGREDMANAVPLGDEARHNHPRWLIDAVEQDWPDDWQQVLAANNDRAPMWLRVNSQHSSVAAYRAELQEAGIDAAVLAGAEQALKLEAAMPVAELPGFEAGHVSVQDAAAQLAAPWLLAGGGRRILDACAAPGGKSGHLLELGGDEIVLTCVDKDPERLASISDNLHRLGLLATVLPGDASNPYEWWDGKPFDGILLDAPCSATGVIRRHPDIKLLRRRSDIAEFSQLQGALLQALWPLLKPGAPSPTVALGVSPALLTISVSMYVAGCNEFTTTPVPSSSSARSMVNMI